VVPPADLGTRRFQVSSGDESRCGRCDNCLRGNEAPEAADEGGPFAPGRWVRHAEWGAGQVLRQEPDQLTVLFDSVGYKDPGP